MKKVLKGIAYVLYLVVIAELSLQAFYWVNAGQPLWRRTASAMFASDPTTGFWNKRHLDFWQQTNEYSSHVVTNADGLRVASPETEYRPGRDSSRYRVLLLGPSFAFGWGVDYEQSFGHVLETLLNDSGFAGGKRVEVINAGVPFMSAHQSFDWYEHRGSAYAPDLVILFTYGSVDVADEYGSERVTVDRAGYLVPRNATRLDRLRGTVKSSGLAFYAWSVYSRLPAWKGSDAGAAKSIEGAGRTLSSHSGFSPDGPEVTKSLATFRRGRELSAAGGARFMVVYFPIAYAVHREDLARWRHLGAEDVDAQIEYDRQFCDYLTAQGVGCLNITPDLVSAVRPGKRLYYWLDVHWTPAGHATAANAVARRLLADAIRSKN